MSQAVSLGSLHASEADANRKIFTTKLNEAKIVTVSKLLKLSNLRQQLEKAIRYAYILSLLDHFRNIT